MHIRPATSADIHLMMQLAVHSTTASQWSRAQYERMFVEPDPHRVALLIEEEDSVRGFLVAHEVANEWELENVVIAQEVQRRGLGTRLVGEFLNYARSQGGSNVFLEVRESNRAARSLYEKWAFAESGRRSRYYTEPQEDAIVYRLDFT